MKRFADDAPLLTQGIKALASLVARGDARAAAREAGVAELVEAIARKEGRALAPGAAGGGEMGDSLRAMHRRFAAEGKK